MINLQLIVSGTLANAGHPERVTNKTKHYGYLDFGACNAGNAQICAVSCIIF
jgi:hypothetical protein